MPSEIEIYQGAVAEAKQAQATVERIIKTISEAAMILRDWRTAMVSNAPAAVGFPPEVALRPKASIDCRQWPTGEDLARGLAHWHQSKARVESAYAAIPESMRSVVTPPRVSM